MLYVIKTADDKYYWCGNNKLSPQLRNAQIYASKKYAKEMCSRLPEKFPDMEVFKLAPVEINEVHE